MQLKIAMVVPQFPAFGETFILSQITGLIDLGQHVDVIAVNPSGETTIHEDVYRYKVLNQTKYLHINRQYGKTWRERIHNGRETFGQCHRLSPEATWATLNAFRYGWQALRLAYLFRLKPFLETRYDIVHCHFGPNAKSFLFLRDLQQVNFMATFHGYDFSRVIKEHGPQFYRELFARADLITINSQYGKGKLLAAGADEKRIVQLRMSVPTDRYPFRERTLKPGETARILTIARLFDKKGYEYSVRAVAKAAQAFPNLEYWIVGDANGPAATRTRDLIRELGMEDKIKILGTKTREALIGIIQQCHLFILASVTAPDGDEEGQGLVLQEAQASGMPVVASRHNGFPESLVDGETGFLVPERDADAMAERILHLLQNPSIWPGMGTAGRKFVEANFDVKKLTRQLLDLYRGLMEKTDE